MNHEHRRRLNALERALASMNATETRAIADLKTAGWQFPTRHHARAWLRTQHTKQKAGNQHDH